MYRNVWEMYKYNNSIKFCKMILILDLNLMYTKVVELYKHYHNTEQTFEIHLIGFEKN